MTIATLKLLFIGIGGSLIIAVDFTGSLMKDVLLLSIYNLLIYVAVSGITSCLGAKLACRYFNL